MSDRPTPETDDQPWINAINEDGYQVPCVDIEFARRLERERDEAREVLRELYFAVQRKFAEWSPKNNINAASEEASK